MRVISGVARGRRLKAVPGDTTRPIMDRVKENLFNIIGRDVLDSSWLDLFAGTGQVGIEALSRGARTAVFLDTAIAAVRTTESNLEITGLTADAVVLRRDAFHYLRSERSGTFDFIYVAPPQYKGLWQRALEMIDARHTRLLSPDGQVIIQIDPQEYSELLLTNLELRDQRVYGRTMLGFFIHQA